MPAAHFICSLLGSLVWAMYVRWTVTLRGFRLFIHQDGGVFNVSLEIPLYRWLAWAFGVDTRCGGVLPNSIHVRGNHLVSFFVPLLCFLGFCFHDDHAGNEKGVVSLGLSNRGHTRW
jgi:hypothetical protein